MPSIDVTMGDGATVDATMAGEAIAVEVNGAGYTDRQARDAVDGSSLGSLGLGELSVNGTQRFATGDYEIISQCGLYGSSRYTVTQTTYGNGVERGFGRWSEDIFPTNTIPKIRFVCRLVNDTAGETTTARAEVAGSGIAATELSVTGTSIAVLDSGWVDAPTGAGDYHFSGVQMKVSGGSGDMLESPALFVAGEYQ